MSYGNSCLRVGVDTLEELEFLGKLRSLDSCTALPTVQHEFSSGSDEGCMPRYASHSQDHVFAESKCNFMSFLESSRSFALVLWKIHYFVVIFSYSVLLLYSPDWICSTPTKCFADPSLMNGLMSTHSNTMVRGPMQAPARMVNDQIQLTEHPYDRMSSSGSYVPSPIYYQQHRLHLTSPCRYADCDS